MRPLARGSWRPLTATWTPYGGPESRWALAWRKGRFHAALEGREAEVQGQMSPPFGIYHGTPSGPIPHGSTNINPLV
ncbi:MAG TPA: hypothetical protein VGM86_00580 [Thermoanaerobaculia bacterium]|jgi:hypothetical protein